MEISLLPSPSKSEGGTYPCPDPANADVFNKTKQNDRVATDVYKIVFKRFIGFITDKNLQESIDFIEQPNLHNYTEI
jgi:hypothetical protein